MMMMIWMDLLKLEQRSVIKFLTKEDNGPRTIYDLISVMIGEHMSSNYQVEVLNKQFKWGRNLVEDDPKSLKAAYDNGP